MKNNSHPGLKWRARRAQRVAYWVCRTDISAKGYQIKTQRLWSGTSEPTAEELAAISEQCKRLQYEMLDWFNSPRAKKRVRHYKAGGNVYFIRFGEMVKIGFAINVAKRLRNLQAGSPGQFELLGAVPGTPLDELTLHRKFEKLRSTGEWFKADPALLNYIHTATQSRSPSVAL